VLLVLADAKKDPSIVKKLEETPAPWQWGHCDLNVGLAHAEPRQEVHRLVREILIFLENPRADSLTEIAMGTMVSRSLVCEDLLIMRSRNCRLNSAPNSAKMSSVSVVVVGIFIAAWYA
jgi:hypothetical protein